MRVGALHFQKQKHFLRSAFCFWRRHPDLNRGIRVLQTRALPLGYGAILNFARAEGLREKVTGLSKQARDDGADYGARTRHLDLGKVALYQMS